MGARIKLLSEKEVEAEFGISVYTLRNQRAYPGADPIPYVKIGRNVRYRLDLLIKWIERNTQACLVDDPQLRVVS